MSEQPIKLQLNSEAAIRSIIDGDPALQIEIKNKIACAIAKGYERIDKQVIASSVAALINFVSEKVKQEITHQEKEGWNYKTVLNKDIQELIKAEVNKEFEYMILKAVNEARKDMTEIIKTRIDLIAEEIVNRTVNDVFQKSVRDEVIRRCDVIQKTIEAEN